MYLRSFMQPWIINSEGKLFREYRFPNFSACMAFMVQAGFLMEKMNHHAEWSNVYNRLEVQLCTHDAGNSITDKDHQLAAAIEQLYQRLYPAS